MPLPYRNLIFDLGGVIINLETNRTVQAFAQLAGQLPDALRPLMAEPFFNEYEKGNLTDEQFRAHVRSALSLSCSDEAIDRAWNAMLLDIPTAKIRLLQQLAGSHRLFLLSNTNPIHFACFNAQVAKLTGHESLAPYFERTYYSHQLNMRKPDEEIYKHVLTDAGLTAAETLFLDDNEANLAGAKRVGIQAFHVHHPDVIFDFFKTR